MKNQAKTTLDKQEVVNEIKTWIDSSSYSDLSVEISSLKEGCYDVTISQMYDFVDVDFNFLEKLSKLFLSKNINIGSRHSQGGCDTCDYGSSYTLSLFIKDSKVSLA